MKRQQQKKVDLLTLKKQIEKEFNQTYCHWTDEMIRQEIKRRLKKIKINAQ